jgi:hypothetical protein
MRNATKREKRRRRRRRDRKKRVFQDFPPSFILRVWKNDAVAMHWEKENVSWQ